MANTVSKLDSITSPCILFSCVPFSFFYQLFISNLDSTKKHDVVLILSQNCNAKWETNMCKLTTHFVWCHQMLHLSFQTICLKYSRWHQGKDAYFLMASGFPFTTSFCFMVDFMDFIHRVAYFIWDFREIVRWNCFTAISQAVYFYKAVFRKFFIINLKYKLISYG